MDTYSEQFKSWMDQHGLSAEALAHLIKKEVGTIHNWRSSGVPKRDSVRAHVSAFMEQYDAERAIEEEHLDVINLEISADRFDAWNRAALAEGMIIRDWAIEGLDRLAKREFADQFPDTGKFISFPAVPLIRAAAGVPILADAEHVEPDRDLGEGRFLLELRGDSMEPRFQSRQRVVLRDKATLKRPALKYGEFYCFVHDGAATFKQWAKDEDGRKVLRSLNQEYADIPADEETDWLGWFDPKDNTETP